MLPIAALLPLVDKLLILAKPVTAIPGATSLIGKVAENGKKAVSKTKVGATLLAAAGPDWPTLIEGAVNGDATAIGTIVLLVVGYALALTGRGNKA